MVELSEITKKEDLILVDATVTNLTAENRDFYWNIYDSRRYSQLPCQVLAKVISSLEHSIDLLAKGSTYTIKDVTDKIRDLERTVNAKVDGFLEPVRLPHAAKKRVKIDNRNKRPKQMMHELQGLVYQARLLCRERQLRLNNPNYELLLDMVKLLESEMYLKKDTSFALGYHSRDQSHESDTAERIVAAIYYERLFHGRDFCLVTRDTDFVSLLGIFTRILGSLYFSPYNSPFRKTFSENPIRLYIGVKNRFSFDIRYLAPSFDEEFIIYKITPQRNSEIMAKINGSMQRLYRSTGSYQEESYQPLSPLRM